MTDRATDAAVADGAGPARPAAPSGLWTGSAGRTFGLAVLVFAPMLLLSLLAWRYDAMLQALLPVDISNLAAAKRMLAGVLHPGPQADSWSPMRHALDVLDGPERDSLYRRLFFQDQVRFQYPPSSLLWLEALGRLGIAGARALNALNTLALATNAALVALLGWLLFRHHQRRRAGAEPALALEPAGVAAVALAASFLFYPVVRAEVLGQIQLWIDVLFTGAVLAWATGRRGLAGALVGVACTIKPQLGLLLAWALLWREWGFAAGLAAVLGPIAAVSVARYGLANHLAYLEVLSFLSRHGESFFANNSVNGVLNWYLSGEDSLRWHDQAFTPYRPLVHAGTTAASALFYGVALAQPLIGRKRRPETADLGAAAICTVIGSPVAWEHHYGLLLPLFLVALSRLAGQAPAERRAGLPLLLLAWCLTANFIPFASLLARGPLAALQGYDLFGAAILLWLLLRRAGRSTAPAPARRAA